VNGQMQEERNEVPILHKSCHCHRSRGDVEKYGRGLGKVYIAFPKTNRIRPRNGENSLHFLLPSRRIFKVYILRHFYISCDALKTVKEAAT
jgi:hypothetical protein